MRAAQRGVIRFVFVLGFLVSLCNLALRLRASPTEETRAGSGIQTRTDPRTVDSNTGACQGKANPDKEGTVNFELGTPMSAVFGPTLLKKKDPRQFHVDLVETAAVNTDTELGNVDVVCAYFSASWCPPCREYTPKLLEIEQQARMLGKSFAVVFISKDRSLLEFNAYFASMSWYALDLAQAQQRGKQLGQQLGISGIPSAVLYHRRLGKIEIPAVGALLKPGFLAGIRSIGQSARTLGAVRKGTTGPTLKVRVRCGAFGSAASSSDKVVDVDPSKGLQGFQFQLFTVSGIAPQQQRICGLGRSKGVLEPSEFAYRMEELVAKAAGVAKEKQRNRLCF